jgi:hypothetical protein
MMTPEGARRGMPFTPAQDRLLPRVRMAPMKISRRLEATEETEIQPCKVQKTGHAARTYSRTTPPRRSRRWTRTSPHSVAGATGGRVEWGGLRVSAR